MEKEKGGHLGENVDKEGKEGQQTRDGRISSGQT
jgi:hypothetical protein